jgi:hypothetical protein
MSRPRRNVQRESDEKQVRATGRGLRGQALRNEIARQSNPDLSLPKGWRLDKDGFPVKGHTRD